MVLATAIQGEKRKRGKDPWHVAVVGSQFSKMTFVCSGERRVDMWLIVDGEGVPVRLCDLRSLYDLDQIAFVPSVPECSFFGLFVRCSIPTVDKDE